jgi:hypothetical protein
MTNGSRRHARLVAGALLACAFVACAAPVALAAAGPKGWFVLTDPRKRAFLIYGERGDDGERVLTLSCLRDVDSFGIFTGDVFGPGPEAVATMTLTRGSASYALEGRRQAGTAGSRFDGDADVEGKTERAALKPKIIGLLKAGGPLLMRLGTEEVAVTEAAVDAKALATFERICFGP